MATQRIFRFSAALVGHEWLEDVAITVDDDGIISNIQQSASGQADQALDVVALPGMVNVHSHAFQRGLAGLSEYRTAQQESFWTWRQLMYDFVAQLTPDDVYVIARQLYLEMLAAGYTWVGEFHYLHNAADGSRYATLSETTDVLVRAAADAGLGICLLPVLYQQANFDGGQLSGVQCRFALTDAEFLRLVDHCQSCSAAHRNVTFGFAFHSLRAVDLRVAEQVVTAVKSAGIACPIHMHVAEQTREVADCVAATGKRPVELIYSALPVDKQWCLIHATHLDTSEIAAIAQSGAVVGLCPTTEANLGDGFFSADPFLEQGGRISIGSDSHCSVDLREELRLLEYGQRLRTQRRAVLGTDTLSVGRRLYEACAAGGARALGLPTTGIAVGNRADLTLIDPHHPAIAGVSGDRQLDRLAFCNSGNPICGTMVGGCWHDIRSDDFSERLNISAREFLELNRRLTR